MIALLDTSVLVARAHVLDRMIAATAVAHGLTVVTRDGPGFAQLDGLVAVDVR